MAGDWLKVEATTPDKPEVFEIASQLGIPVPEAFGRLFLVWRWFDAHTEKGNGDNVTSAYIDHIAGVTGFADAMRSVGWLSGGDGQSCGIGLPNFSAHNGKTAKSRALTARRVAMHKKREGNDKVTLIPLPREEKRREVTPSPLFEIFWRSYPRKEAKQDAIKAFAKLKLADGDFERVMQSLEAAKGSSQWQRDGGKFVPHAATWLNGRRFEDEVAPQQQERRVAI